MRAWREVALFGNAAAMSSCSALGIEPDNLCSPSLCIASRLWAASTQADRDYIGFVKRSPPTEISHLVFFVDGRRKLIAIDKGLIS